MAIARKLIISISIIIFLVAGTMLAQYFYGAYQDAKNFQQIQPSENGEDLETEKGIIIGKYAKLWEQNHDLIGWIKIEGTSIDYPVMQTVNEPQYYLHRNFKTQESKSGTPFMDEESDIFLPTGNFLIYGHNMKSGAMFHDLLEYQDEDFYQDHKTINFDTIYKGGQGAYKVVAAAKTQVADKDSKAFKYYQCAGITSEEEFNNYVKEVKKEACYDTGVVPEYGQQLITLSTCTNTTKEGRFYVLAVRVE